ncbi:hypothetical protein A3C57_01190 [Candidatus Nomurabacteria bacterium RIFCSPHIGHO2_02_FULL_33_12]|nr:MAG: hypothetical protein A3C57_01190 [Candidatus Nomurabacteria bacterium RIFCSPHIGHO2_02_FULL_33_12]
MEIFFSLFSGIATLLTGGVAIGIYFYQKRDTKIQAARVLLTEIRIAEERIDQIRDKVTDNSTADLPSVFPTKSWKQYSHLFISDFDQDELKLINSFYDYGEIVEDFAKRNNDFFWITTEERARVTVQKISDFIEESYSQPDPHLYVSSKRDLFNSKLDVHNLPYAPKKTLDGIRDYLNKIHKITTSSCGIKLKQLSGFK